MTNKEDLNELRNDAMSNVLDLMANEKDSVKLKELGQALSELNNSDNNVEKLELEKLKIEMDRQAREDEKKRAKEQADFETKRYKNEMKIALAKLGLSVAAFVALFGTEAHHFIEKPTSVRQFLNFIGKN